MGSVSAVKTINSAIPRFKVFVALNKTRMIKLSHNFIFLDREMELVAAIDFR